MERQVRREGGQDEKRGVPEGTRGRLVVNGPYSEGEFPCITTGVHGGMDQEDPDMESRLLRGRDPKSPE